MQNIVMPDVFVGIEMEPALAAFVLGSAIPRDRQCLQPPIGEFDQVLLKRVHAKSVFHLISCKLSVGPICLDEKFPVLAEEPGLNIEILKARVFKIAEH